MKIKSSKNIDMKKLLIVWIAAAVILLPTRIYQLLKIVDLEQGFYLKTDFSVGFMYGFLAVLLILFVAGSYLSSKATEIKSDYSGNKLLGGVSIAVSVSMVVNVITQFSTFLDLYKGFGSQFGVTTMELGEYMMKSGALSKLGEAVFALFSAIYFVLFGLGCFGEKIKIEKLRILAITPVAWSIFRMLTRLIRTISYIKVSDLFYEIIMILFMMVFFMAFAQVNAKVNEKGIEWKIFGYGFFASLMALICSVPRLVMVIIGKGDILSADSPLEIWDLLIAVFIIVYIVGLISCKKKEKSETEE